LAALTNVPTLQAVVTAGNTATGIGDLTIAGRVVHGNGLTVADISATSYGAKQAGLNVSSMTIGNNSHGAQQDAENSGTMTIGANASGSRQAGLNAGGTMTIGGYAYGAQQAVENLGTMSIGGYASGAHQAGLNSGTTMTIGDYARGAQQSGVNVGTMTIGSDAVGAQQDGFNYGTMAIGQGSMGAMQRLFVGSSSFERAIIGNYCYGASQFGMVYYAAATNDAIGAMQLLNLSAGQSATITADGDASIGLGACVVSNKQSIVAGDGQQSHGDATITAGGGFYVGETPVVTNYAATPFDAAVTITNTSAMTITSYFGHAYSRTFTSTGTITHVFLGNAATAGNEIFMETTATGLPARVWPAGYVFGYAGSISSNAPSPTPWAQMSVQKTPMGSIVWCVTGQVWQAGTP
jgi:hypothetical protein